MFSSSIRFAALAMLPSVFADQKVFNLNIVNAQLSPDGFARTSGMDGFVNQCPIAPGNSFDYVFDTADQTGNYWYHSHLLTQYCDGLRDPNDPLAYLYTIITLAEWYHVLAPAGQDSFFKTGIIPEDMIELDGVEHDPTPFQNADCLSVILNANQPTGGSPANNPNFNTSLTLAILHYEGALDVEPTTVNVPRAAFNDSLMHPIASQHPGGLGSAPADLYVVLNIAQPHLPFFDINRIPSDFIPSEQLILLPSNSIIEISIPGAGVHGHNFDIVLASGQVTPNYINPPRRDVVSINGPNITFRFQSNNPGAWFLHCHIDWHLEAGLAVVLGKLPAANIDGPQS
ncbi:laccase-2 [Mycena maculata]|uniref:Laccase-2 n=1 Tax=Mycena maculata TaxID=230809 RepID=A0AAD7NI10_9AGAR|nr:laccase-2 [Mycena maculata]